MGETAESFYLAGRDAATQEREDRLAKAKRKLKSYRAKQAKSGSSNTSLDPTSRPSSAASGSTNIHRSPVSRSGILNPIASTSKGVSVASHGRKSSLSRASRSSFSHNHTRSKASISISVSAPTTTQEPSYAYTPEFNSPAMSTFDNPYAAPTKPNRTSWSSQLSAVPSSSRDHSSPSTSSKRLSNSLDPRTAYSPSPSGSPSPLPHDNLSSHNRRSSRHSRRLSVTNFRESIEIVSGQGNYSGVLTPTVGSFAAPPVNSYELSPSGSPNMGWSNDPIKVLEALKERGRQETEMENDQKRTRLGALEALEGRLSAPSEMIDLGNEEDGQLLHAPPSPGYTAGSIHSAPSSPTPVFSPMYGLGLVNAATPVNLKRNSWNAGGPVVPAGAKGALDLGMLIEEEEEEEEEEGSIASLPSSLRKSRSSPKKRPTSLALVAPPLSDSIAVSSPLEEPPLSASFSARPMRLSMSLSSSTSSAITPSPSTSHFPEQPQSRPAAPLRSLTLGSVPHSAPLSREPSSEGLSPKDRRQSLLYSRSTDTSPAAPPTRGLRPLSIGSFPTSLPSDHQIKQRSPIQVRTALPLSTSLNSATSTPSPRNATAAAASKRSSISYRTSSVASLASSDGPLSASAQAARRPWRTSMSGTSISSTSSSIPGPTGNMPGFGFPASHGAFGGFGDLQVDEEDEDEEARRPESSIGGKEEAYSAATEALNAQLGTLQFQLEQVNSTLDSQTIRHGIEMEEFEKRAGEEARGMRMRISDLEKQIEEITVLRRFEVEGLTREVEQAKEAVMDLVEERDSLVEDVDGWRSRCSILEKQVRKDKEDESLSNAQIKLIGEMRDQIYHLVAALDRERVDHDETRLEVERILVEGATTPPIDEEDEEEFALVSRGDSMAIVDGSHRHAFNTASDASVLSTSSFGNSLSGNITEATSVGTDSEDNASKFSSPTSSHHSFPGSKSHENDFASAIAIGGLQTLAEEEEEVVEEREVVVEKEDLVVVKMEQIEEVLEVAKVEPVREVKEIKVELEAPVVVKTEEVESFPLAVSIPERERDEDRVRMGSGSTGSTEESEVMPMTPSKESMTHHNRSDSFVRHWSFPKGSISSVRASEDEEHSFFDLNRHTSLPALPIPESILPPFLCADLMVDEEQFAPFIPVTVVAPAPVPPPTRAPFTSPPQPQGRFSPQIRSPTQERLAPSASIRSPTQGGRQSPKPLMMQGRMTPPPPPHPGMVPSVRPPNNQAGRMSPQILSPSQGPNQSGRMSPQILSPTQGPSQVVRMSPQVRSPPPPPPQVRSPPPPSANQVRNYPQPSSNNLNRSGPPPSSSHRPPVSPSGLHQSAFGSSVSSQGSFSLNSPSRLARLGQLSLTNIVTSLGGWSPSSSVSAVTSRVAAGNLSMSTSTIAEREDEEERMFMAQSNQNQHKTPSSLSYESRSVQKFIRHNQQPRPLPSRLQVLDFRPVCCASDNTPLFNL